MKGESIMSFTKPWLRNALDLLIFLNKNNDSFAQIVLASAASYWQSFHIIASIDLHVSSYHQEIIHEEMTLVFASVDSIVLPRANTSFIEGLRYSLCELKWQYLI
jgi:hypothetical protein